MKSKLLLTIFLTISVLFTGCFEEEKKTKSKLLIYCGITMVKPMTVLAQRFEEKENIEIKITQGGSKDLYESLKASKVGDLYLPGSASYRKNNIEEGLLGEFVFLGHNRASIVVAKGNPKGIKKDLKELTNPDLKVVLCNPESGSIGRMTKKVLTKVGINEEAFANAKFLTTDSRNLTKALKEKEADIVVNWHATTKWPENRDFVEAIEIDERYAPKKKLLLNSLTFSKNPELTKKFLEYASSEEGLAVFREYGF